MTSKCKRGFTLIELLVVIAMIMVIIGAMTSAVFAAQNRARIQKATADVKVIAQAILAYENYERGGDFKLPTMNRASADSGTLGFLLGQGGSSSQSSQQIPVLLMAAFQSGETMRDPWGTPYAVTIREGSGGTGFSLNLQTRYFLPNFYRLADGEREL